MQRLRDKSQQLHNKMDRINNFYYHCFQQLYDEQKALADQIIKKILSK